MNWIDPRLAYNKSQVHSIRVVDSSTIWIPDVFFPNERTSFRPGPFRPSELVKIYPNGYVFYSSLISLVLNCQHDYSFYPFDKPACRIKIATYGYTTDDLVLIWKEYDSILSSNRLGLPNLIVRAHESDYCTSRGGPEYSCMLFTLTMERILGKIFLQTFIPTTFILVLTFSSFWLGRSYLRILLTSIAFLVLTINLMSNMLTRSSQHSIITALDIWNFVCVIFSLVSLLINIKLDHKYSRNQKTCGSQKQNDNSVDDFEKSNMKDQLITEKTFQIQLTWLQKLKQINFNNEKTIIVFVRIVLPFLFVIFNISYVLYVIFAQDHYYYY